MSYDYIMENETAMTLSPAAQAVLTTYEKVWGQGYGSPLAAALRAAAKQSTYADTKVGVTDEVVLVDTLLAIATELEGAN